MLYSSVTESVLKIPCDVTTANYYYNVRHGVSYYEYRKYLSLAATGSRAASGGPPGVLRGT